MKPHREYMLAALKLAKAAESANEVPVGAIVVSKGTIIGQGMNRVESLFDPCAHAEMEALAEARENSGGKWLPEAILYCTLEPCPMCAGAAVLYRIKRIVFGASDIRWGACGTLFNIPQNNALNYRIEVIGGIMEKECGELLRNFFRKHRE